MAALENGLGRLTVDAYGEHTCIHKYVCIILHIECTERIFYIYIKCTMDVTDIHIALYIHTLRW